MSMLRSAGLFLVLLTGAPAYAHSPDSPNGQPETGPPEPAEVRPEVDPKQSESRPATAAEATTEGTPASGAEATTAVDPELAAAAARDAAASAEPTRLEGLAAPAAVTPMVQLNPDISFIMNTAFGWFSRREHLRQGGHAVDENGFVPQALELAASGAVDPYFRFDLYFQIMHLHLEEAFLTSLSLPGGLQARAGYFNVAFGRQNPQHLHTWHFVNPPLSHTRFMSEEHFSGTGAELSLLLPLPWYALILAEVMTPSAATAFRSATFGTIELNGNRRTDGLEDFLYVGRMENFLELSADWSLLVAASAAFGQSPYVPDNRAALYGGDLYLKWRPLRSGGNVAVALTVEAVLRDTQVPRDSVRDGGGYVQLDVQMSRRFVAGVRGDLTDLIRGPSPNPTKIPGRQTRGSFALTFLPTHFSKLRLQADVTRAEAHGRTVVAVFLQTEVSAGEHGAHRF